MLGRLVVCQLNLGVQLRDVANLHCLCSLSSPWKTGLLQIRNLVRFPGQRVYSSARTTLKNPVFKLSLVHRLTIGLCTAAGIKTLSSKSLVYCASQQPHPIRTADYITAFHWGKFWLTLRPHIWHLLAAIVSALVVAFLNIRIPLVLGQVVNVLVNFLTNKTMDQCNIIKAMMQPASQLVVLYAEQAFFTFVYIHLLSIVGERVAKSMKLQLFSSILNQDVAFFDCSRTGDIVSRLTVDIQDFKSSFKTVISQGIRSIAQIIGCGTSLFLISPQMTYGMLIVVPVVILCGTLLGSLLRRMSLLVQAQASQVTLISEEALSNIRTVRAFAMEQAEYELFLKEANKLCNLSEQLGFGIGLFQGGANLFLNGLVLGTMCVGGKLMTSGELAAGDVMSFLVATQTIQRSLAQLSLLFGTAIKGLAAGAMVFEMINLKPNIPLSGGIVIPFHTMSGEVTFHNVSFAYPTRPEQKIFDGFYLRIAPGTTVAVVGASGSGKSTIAALLERFYDVDEGSITIDGIDLQKLDPTWLRGKAIGFINQEPVLFAASIMENIRYGKRDATDQEVMEVAKLANADDFIRQFPDGYDTVVGERGATVSGGQKQRIAIARALLKNPSILILDEATSALDAKSEKLVQDALDKLAKGRTVLVIAHRLSTVKNADFIVVLHNGIIVEAGTHDSLTLRKGFYWNLFRHQELH